MKKHANAAVLMVLLAGALWGSMGLFVRGFGSAGLDSMQIVAVRLLTAAAMLTAGLAVIKPGLLKIKFKHLWCFLGTGLLSLSTFTFCYFSALQHVSMAVAAVLLYTAPAMVVVMAAFVFHEKITKRKVAACITAFTGCLLVSGLLGGGQQAPLIGVALGVLSAVGYALYSIFARLHSLTVTTYTFITAAIGTAFITDLPVLTAALSGRWGTALLMGLVTAAAPYVLYTLGLARLEASKAALLASVEPVTAAILGAILFHEIPDAFSLIGIGLVLASVLMLSLPERTEENT